MFLPPSSSGGQSNRLCFLLVPSNPLSRFAVPHVFDFLGTDSALVVQRPLEWWPIQSWGFFGFAFRCHRSYLFPFDCVPNVGSFFDSSLINAVLPKVFHDDCKLLVRHTFNPFVNSAILALMFAGIGTAFFRSSAIFRKAASWFGGGGVVMCATSLPGNL